MGANRAHRELNALELERGVGSLEVRDMGVVVRPQTEANEQNFEEFRRILFVNFYSE